MLTKQEKEQFRGTVFRHLDGIATSTTAYTLHKKGVLDYILKHKKINLKELTTAFNANALRVLCSQGWLNQYLDNANDIICYEINEKSQTAFKLVPLYKDVINLLSYSVNFPEEGIGTDAFIELERIFKKHKTQFGLSNSRRLY